MCKYEVRWVKCLFNFDKGKLEILILIYIFEVIRIIIKGDKKWS